MIGIEVHRAPEVLDRLVPLLVLDADAPEQVVALREVRSRGHQPPQHRPRLVVVLLLEVELGQREVAVRRLGVQRDRLLQRGLRLRQLLLSLVEVGQRHVGARVARLERDRLLGRGERAREVVEAHQPLGELDPEDPAVGIGLDRFLQLRDGLGQAAGPRLHLGDHVVVVGFALGPDGPARGGGDRDDRGRGRLGLAAAGGGAAREGGGQRAAGQDEDRERARPSRDEVLGDEAPHRRGQLAVGDGGQRALHERGLVGVEAKGTGESGRTPARRPLRRGRRAGEAQA